MLNLYCSLRKIHGRVSHNVLREHYTNTHEFKQGCTVETALWFVPKLNFEKGVPPRLAEFEVSPRAADGLSPQAQDIDFAQYLLFDKACDRALLGKGISQVRFHINSSEKFSRKDMASASSGSVDPASWKADCATPSAAEPRADGSNVVASGPVVVAEGGPPPKRRQLVRTNSDTTVITQQVLQRMQSAAARGDFTSTDATSPDMVELWVRMVVRSMADWKKS